MRELWLVDPDACTVTVTDAEGRQTRAGHVCESGVLDGFTVETAALFNG